MAKMTASKAINSPRMSVNIIVNLADDFENIHSKCIMRGDIKPLPGVLVVRLPVGLHDGYGWEISSTGGILLTLCVTLKSVLPRKEL